MQANKLNLPQKICPQRYTARIFNVKRVINHILDILLTFTFVGHVACSGCVAVPYFVFICLWRSTLVRDEGFGKLFKLFFSVYAQAVRYNLIWVIENHQTGMNIYGKERLIVCPLWTVSSNIVKWYSLLFSLCHWVGRKRVWNS